MKQALVEFIKEHCPNPKSGVEIGVYKGETSEVLLQAFPQCMFWFVDPWKEWAKDESYSKHRRTGKLTQKQWDEIAKEAKSRILAHEDEGVPGRLNILDKTSEKAALWFDEHLAYWKMDLSFIDSNHTYEAVVQDVDIWLERTTRFICGHDYGGHYKGVKQAVDEKFGEENVLRSPRNRDRLWGFKIESD